MIDRRAQDLGRAVDSRKWYPVLRNCQASSGRTGRVARSFYNLTEKSAGDYSSEIECRGADVIQSSS